MFRHWARIIRVNSRPSVATAFRAARIELLCLGRLFAAMHQLPRWSSRRAKAVV